ncbi:MAG TPA: type II toxin-antitoxin system VapB family antitoxin [Caulobacteraceae bacterium]|nr:type II toxin-antitoxin system VapB family antitoxin [Caulobacteraceae bacterium]
MAFHIRDPETDSLVRELARRDGLGLTDAVKLAVKKELERKQVDVEERRKRMRAIVEEIARWPETGLKADKAFYDDLSGQADD